MRRITQLEKLYGKTFHPAFNERACIFFDDLNCKRGWRLQHALNGGEVKVRGYFLDAYDAINNIVVEYDEPRHYTRNGRLHPKDITRQNEILKICVVSDTTQSKAFCMK